MREYKRLAPLPDQQAATGMVFDALDVGPLFAEADINRIRDTAFSD